MFTKICILNMLKMCITFKYNIHSYNYWCNMKGKRLLSFFIDKLDAIWKGKNYISFFIDNW